jgi:hypothetical protein
MNSPTITVARQTGWPRNLTLIVAAVVVALIVAVSVVAARSGHATSRAPTFGQVSQSAPVAVDCLIRSSLHSPC